MEKILDNIRDKSKKQYNNKAKVIMLNDDYSTMEFVMKVLIIFFDKNQSEAFNIMMDVHMSGSAVCGHYDVDIARTKVHQVISYARANEQPLKCIVDKE